MNNKEQEKVWAWKRNGRIFIIRNTQPLVIQIELNENYEKPESAGGYYKFDGYFPISITDANLKETVHLQEHFKVYVSDDLVIKFESFKHNCELYPWGNGHNVMATLDLVEVSICNCTTTIGHYFELLDFEPYIDPNRQSWSDNLQLPDGPVA